MRKALACAAIIFLSAFKGGDGNSVSSRQPCISRLDGKGYAYSFRPGKPNMTYYFMFYCEGDSMRAIILGPSSNGKFFRANVNSLQLNGDSIGFNFIEGELFNSPFTLGNYRNYGPIAVGFSSDRIFYKGTIKGDTLLNLRCQTKYYSCLADTLIFRKS